MNHSFKDLMAWQKAMGVADAIYRLTQTFPKHELYGLSIQMRRAAVSVPSNIAEGKGRSTDRDFVHFLHQSRGSLHELETQLLIASRLGYVDAGSLERTSSELHELGRILNGLITAIEQKAAARAAYARGKREGSLTTDD
jgi:four helix bundle protein